MQAAMLVSYGRVWSEPGVRDRVPSARQYSGLLFEEPFPGFLAALCFVGRVERAGTVFQRASGLFFRHVSLTTDHVFVAVFRISSFCH